MQITVLGKSPSWQDVDGACSGYLIQEGESTLLVDCGCGVFSKLRRYRDYAAVDAVVISHLHADHFLDLVPYAYALCYSPRLHPQQAAGGEVARSGSRGVASPSGPIPATRGESDSGSGGASVAVRQRRPRLYAPAGATEKLRRVVGAWGSESLIEEAFELTEYAPRDTVEVGSLRVKFQAVPHFVPTFAVDVSSTDGGGRITYGADHRPTDDLVNFADGADLLLIEATLTEPESDGPRGHLTPAEAGDHGSRSNVGRLVLTHISDELDQERAAREAAQAFGRPVSVAQEGAVYTV